MSDEHVFPMLLIGAIFLAVVGAVTIAILVENAGFRRRMRHRHQKKAEKHPLRPHAEKHILRRRTEKHPLPRIA